MSQKSWFTDPADTYAKKNNLFLVTFDFSTNQNRSDRKFLGTEDQKPSRVAKSATLPSLVMTDTMKEKVPIGGTELIMEGGFIDWQPVVLTFNDIMHRPTTFKPAPGARSDTLFVQEKLRRVASPEGFDSFYSNLLYAVWRGLGDSGRYQGATSVDLPKFNSIFRGVSIQTIDDYGFVLEEWKLKKPFFREFKSPELNYENSKIREFSITIDYIVAEYIAYNPDGSKMMHIFKHRAAGDPDNPYSIGLKQ